MTNETQLQEAKVPLVSPFTVIDLGFGAVKIGDSLHNGSVPALWFGKDGLGMGVEEVMNRAAVDGETVAVVTFANVEGLDVLLEVIQRIRRVSFPTSPAPALAGDAQPGQVLRSDGVTREFAAPPLPVAQDAKPADLSKRLRALAIHDSQPLGKTMGEAADEIERYYGAMLAWKQTAETKDRKLSEEICARVDERVAARIAAAVPAVAQDALPDMQALFTRIDDAVENYVRFGAICEFEGNPMIYASTLLEIGNLLGELAPNKLAAPSVAPASMFPERDTSKPAEQQGIFRKFDVRRTDGSDAPGGKHHGCRYFILDLDHDRCASPAMRAYAKRVRPTHPKLADDIEAEFGVEVVHAPSVAVAQDAQGDLTRIYDLFSIGSEARTIGTLLVNIRNTIDFSDKLHAVEREFFMVPGEPDEDDPGSEPDDECLVNSWGSTTEQYLVQFRDAIAKVAAPSLPAVAPQKQSDADYDATRAKVIEALRGHRMVRMFEVEDGGLGNSYPLVDRLSLDDGADIESGNAEIEAIADAVLDALAAPQQPEAEPDASQHTMSMYASKADRDAAIAAERAVPVVGDPNDPEIVALLAALGTDCEKSIHDDNPVLQVRTTVIGVRNIINAYLATQRAVPAVDELSDEEIEAAAKVTYRIANKRPSGRWDAEIYSEQRIYRDSARAILAAARSAK